MIEKRDLHLIFETVAGSHLYGTNTESSDLDLRGVGIATLRHALGIERFDQLESKEPDRTIFSLQKFFALAADANPNIIELLFAPQQHWLWSDHWWLRVVEHRNLFLSLKARHTFGGYAFSQLNRIKNHKRWMDDPPEKPDRAAMGLSIESAIQEDALKALATIPASIIGDLSRTVHLEKEYITRKKEWDSYKAWKENRNKDRYALEVRFGYDTKHAMHLVRLLRMGVELLCTGELNVDRRGIDADELLEIRNGAWAYDHLIAWAEMMDGSMAKLYDANRAKLPRKPDRKAINNLLMDILCDFFGIDPDTANMPFYTWKDEE